jgi:hypothetical protein
MDFERPVSQLSQKQKRDAEQIALSGVRAAPLGNSPLHGPYEAQSRQGSVWQRIFAACSAMACLSNAPQVPGSIEAIRRRFLNGRMAGVRLTLRLAVPIARAAPLAKQIPIESGRA